MSFLAFAAKQEKMNALVRTGNTSDFAKSLCKQWASKGDLSDKQWLWVDKLIAKAKEEPKLAKQVEVPGAFVAMMGAGKLKQPKVSIPCDGNLISGLYLRMSKAQTYVAVIANDSDGVYLGKIDQTEKFHPTMTLRGTGGYAEEATEVVGALEAFGDSPVEVAKAYAKQTGCCCFCKKELTVPASVFAGYGPKCAANYGLPYGETA